MKLLCERGEVGASFSEIRGRVGGSTPTLSYRLNLLAAASLLRNFYRKREREGYYSFYVPTRLGQRLTNGLLELSGFLPVPAREQEEIRLRVMILVWAYPAMHLPGFQLAQTHLSLVGATSQTMSEQVREEKLYEPQGILTRFLRVVQQSVETQQSIDLGSSAGMLKEVAQQEKSVEVVSAVEMRSESL